MTPSALTPAARGSTKKKRPDSSSRPTSARGTGHRSTVRRSASPSAPRRVSGPAGGVAAASAAGGVIAVPPPTRTRPSRPARPARPPRTRTPRSAARSPWRLRTSAYVRRLPDHALLDRIIRGRVWIPLLGLLLAGIVAMQVEVLKLNAGIGRSLERGSALQAQNELLRASVAQLSDEQRIERMAAQMGMVMPAPEQLHFVHTGPSSVMRALSGVHAPDATTFIAQLPMPGAPAARQGTSVNNGVGLNPTGTSSTTSSTATSATATSATATSSTGTAASTGAAGTGAATAGSTSGTSAVTPTTSTTPSGSSDQTGSSSSGGATPVGG
jgi:hypothetical protein